MMISMTSEAEQREKEIGEENIMSQCLVPNWNLKQQRQEQVEGEEEGIGRSSSHHHHVHSNCQQQNYPHPATTFLVPMSAYDEVAELTWENGQLSMHGLGGLQEKPTWGKAHDTLESIVQQATLCQPPQNSKFIREDHAPTSTSSIAASSRENQNQMVPTLTRKRTRSSFDCHGRDFSSKNSSMLKECDIPSRCASASASATFCRDNNDTTMMTCTSLESGRSYKNKTLEEDSACQCGSEIQDDRDTKAQIGRSNSTRRNRIAATHNQSERRRRDRINEKMKALQRLVPNANKTDKASMLEEVISYLKQLQAQIQMMSMTGMPQMMTPLAMQQQLHMSMLARIGPSLGMGMRMVNINNMAAPSRSFPQLIPPTTIVGPSFMMPSLIQAHPQYFSAPPKHDLATSSNINASVPLPDPYNSVAFTQPISMDLLNNMATLYRKQIGLDNRALSSLSQPNHEQAK